MKKIEEPNSTSQRWLNQAAFKTKYGLSAGGSGLLVSMTAGPVLVDGGWWHPVTLSHMGPTTAKLLNTVLPPKITKNQPTSKLRLQHSQNLYFRVSLKNLKDICWIFLEQTLGHWSCGPGTSISPNQRWFESCDLPCIRLSSGSRTKSGWGTCSKKSPPSWINSTSP